jgi:ribosome-binding factor A
MAEARRPRRVAETIRKHVAEALARDIHDPRLQGLSVTRVELGADLSVAHIYLRAMIGAPNEEARRGIERAAASAMPTLRRGLTEKLALRRLPELRAHYDDQQDSVDRIQALLHEIREDLPPEDS